MKAKDFGICAIKLQVTLTNLLVICFYRSPTGDFNYFLNQLELVLNQLYKVSTTIDLCGDFNIVLTSLRPYPEYFSYIRF